MSRPGFWSEPTRLWLKACGRQDLIDRGDALAQRVTALLVAVRQRADQYLEEDDLYSGRAAPGTTDPAAALNELDEFVNVRLWQEISALEAFLTTFDDLRSRVHSDIVSRPSPADVASLCDRLTATVFDDNLAGFCVGADPSGAPSVVALTVTDPGPGAEGLCIAGFPFAVSRAPRSLRRRIFSRAT